MKESIIVLGMHRSGTSVLTGLVSILGAYAGSSLMAPTKENPKGYFENNKVYFLNEKILQENESSWDDYTFSLEKISPEKIDEYVIQAKNIIQDELKYVKKIIIKDPRICLLFPIWERALNELDIKIKILLAYRSPMEVAFSLKARDQMPVEKGLLLWSHYFFLSEFFSRNYERQVVHFDDDFHDFEFFVEKLADFTGNDLTELCLESAKSFYSPKLKHQNISLENISLQLPPYLNGVISLLREREFDDSSRLDKFHEEFINSTTFYLWNNESLQKQLLNRDENKTLLETRLQEALQEQMLCKQLQEELQQKLLNKEQGIEELNNELFNSKEQSKKDLLDKQTAILNKDEIIKQLNEELSRLLEELQKNKYIIEQTTTLLNNTEEELTSLKGQEYDEKLKQEILEKQVLAEEKNHLKFKLEEKRNRISFLENSIVSSERVLLTTIKNKVFRRHIQNNLNATSTLTIKKLFYPFLSRQTKKLLNEKSLIIKSGAFSPLYYLSMYPDVLDSGIDPLIHYCKYGWKEGRRPAASFDINRYLEKNPNLIKAGINPLVHFIRSKDRKKIRKKTQEGRNNQVEDKTYSLFDEVYYLAQYQDVRVKGIDPFQHYMNHGWKEGRDPSAEFCTDFYLQCNPDVEKAGINPLQHYVASGQYENRTPKNGQIRTIPVSSQSPSILFVGHSAIQSGAEVVLLDIVKWYAENTTYKISVLLLRPGILSAEFMRYGDVLTLNEPRELLSEKTTHFLAFHYDLIYLNTVVSGLFSDVYKRDYAHLNIPVVLHVHEMEKVIETHKASYDGIVDDVDLYIAASSRVADDLINKYNIDQNKISTHYSFVRNNAPNNAVLSRQVTKAREYFGLNDDDMVIMGAGTLYWRKGPDIFLDTVKKVIDQYRDKNIIAIWIGEGEDFVELQSRVKENGLTDNVRFTGFLKNASELLAAADVFFLSSREDPFPLVCLEAAQYAVPVVCFSEATGMTEFIRDDAGLVLPEISSNLAAKSLLDLLKNDVTREKLGSKARTRFVSQYSSGVRIQSIFHDLKNRYQFPASVSVIVPNYNHEAYLTERIDSVIKQGFYDLEILLLDDASTDNSLAVIESYQNDPRVTVLTNQRCSGSPFKQWQKGIGIAQSEYIWIAESDDVCSVNLVKELLSAFNDQQVVLSYCKSEIIDEHGNHIPNALTPYMERAHPTKFKTPYVLDGNREVEENFAVACTIVNGSSVIFKKALIMDALDEAMQFKMCGDWYVYLHALSHGKIAYSTHAINYFRRHQTSTVHAVEGTDVYFKERFEIAKEVVKLFNVSETVLKKMLAEVDSEWARFKHIPKKKPYDILFDKEDIIQSYKSHVVPPMKIGFYVHGFLFSKGGIERLAADLANFLSNRGHEIVIYCRKHKGRPVYDISPDISVIPVFDENNKATIAEFRKSLEGQNLDVFVPMLSEWIFEPVIEAAEGLGFPIIASEHNSPEHIEALWWSHKQRVATFLKVDKIHLIREGFRRSLPESFKNDIYVIPNGSHRPNFKIDYDKNNFKRLLAVGRLAEQKRFDRLIKAFAKAINKIDSGWVLDIYGDGADKEKLESLIAEFGLQDRLRLRGLSKHVEAEYLRSELLVISSEFEAGPIVAVEAKMHGLPCIGYADCPGTNEAIRHNIDGLLAEPDEDGRELSKAIIQLCNDEELRKKFSAAGMQDSLRYDMNITSKQWEKMLLETKMMFISSQAR